MPAKTVKRESPYLRVGTTIYKRVRQPLSSGRSVETLIPWNVETLRADSLPACRGHLSAHPRLSHPYLRRAGRAGIRLSATALLQRLPVLLLVSDERNTGKTTFLNLLKSIFGGNVTFNTNEDLAVPSSFAPR